MVLRTAPISHFGRHVVFVIFCSWNFVCVKLLLFFLFFHFFSLFFLPDAERRAVGCSRVAASAAAVSQLPRLCITYYSKYPRQPPNQLRETRISFVKPGARADGRSIVLLLRNLELSESRLQRQSRESEREREVANSGLGHGLESLHCEPEGHGFKSGLLSKVPPPAAITHGFDYTTSSSVTFLFSDIFFLLSVLLKVLSSHLHNAWKCLLSTQMRRINFRGGGGICLFVYFYLYDGKDWCEHVRRIYRRINAVIAVSRSFAYPN